MANSRFHENPITVSGWKKREQNAKERSEDNKVDPEVRAARAAILARREEAMAAENEAIAQKASRPAELYHETLALVPDNLLEELQRILPSLATREMGDIVSDVLTGRRRARHAADLASASTAPEKPAKAR